MTKTVDLVRRALGSIPQTEDHLQLLGAAVYSWWRPFPSLVYLPAEPDVRALDYVDSFARALTELAGRSRDRGDTVTGYERGQAYAGPEPFLLTGTHPSEPASSDHGRYIRKIIAAMAASQSPALMPDVTDRIRLVVITGDAPLPGSLAEPFLEVTLQTDVPYHRWEAMDRGRDARLELAAAIDQWVEDHRAADSDFFSSWEDDDHTPEIAARIGQEILSAFMIDEGLPAPLTGGRWTPAAQADSVRRIHRREHPTDPALVMMMRDLMRDALATRRARMVPGSSDVIDLGRVSGDRLHVLPQPARELVLATGHTTASAGVFSRSLAVEGWIKRAPDGAWTVLRRIDGKLTRVWDMPAEFLGAMVEYLTEDDPNNPAKELAEAVRNSLRSAVAEGRVVLAPSSDGAVDLGRQKSGRLYIVPAVARQLLAEAGLQETPTQISRALEVAGWISPERDGSKTVPRRIDEKMLRVWNLPPSFLGSDDAPSPSPE